MAWGLSLAGGVGVVLGLVGPVGCLWWVYVDVTFYTAVFRVRGALPPLDVGTFSWFLMHLVLALLAFCLKIRIRINYM